MANNCHGVHAQLETYLDRTRWILTALAAGDLSEAEAINEHSTALTSFDSYAIRAFVDRLSEPRVAPQAAERPQSGLTPAGEPVERPDDAKGTSYVHRAHIPHAGQEPQPSLSGTEVELPSPAAAPPRPWQRPFDPARDE